MTADEGFRGHVGLQVTERQEGRATVVLDAADEHLNPGGAVHGGAVATLVDSAMGEAVAAGSGDATPVTIELKVTYLEPSKPGRLEARAEVRKRGSRITIVETEVTQDGELVAHAIGTFTTIG
jgi:uncharacterized protein (TIGR00369 family)